MFKGFILGAKSLNVHRLKQIVINNLRIYFYNNPLRHPQYVPTSTSIIVFADFPYDIYYNKFSRGNLLFRENLDLIRLFMYVYLRVLS